MGNILQYSIEWLGLVIPGLAFAGAIAFLLRGWLSRSFWHGAAAWILGIIISGGVSFLIVWLVSMKLQAGIDKCWASPNDGDCAHNVWILGPFTIIGLISTGLWIVGPPLNAVFTLFKRMARSGAPA